MIFLFVSIFCIFLNLVIFLLDMITLKSFLSGYCGYQKWSTYGGYRDVSFYLAQAQGEVQSISHLSKEVDCIQTDAASCICRVLPNEHRSKNIRSPMPKVHSFKAPFALQLYAANHRHRKRESHTSLTFQIYITHCIDTMVSQLLPAQNTWSGCSLTSSRP